MWCYVVFIFGNHPRAQKGDTFSNLWMLTAFLRCGERGQDAAFLRGAEKVRARSRSYNWQQILSLSQSFKLSFDMLWV